LLKSFKYEKIKILIIVSFAFIINAQNLVINYFSAKNNTTYYDNNFFQFSDWIELHNTSTSSIDLSEYFLTRIIHKKLAESCKLLINKRYTDIVLVSIKWVNRKNINNLSSINNKLANQ